MSPLKIVKQKVYVTGRRGLDIFNYIFLIMTQANWFLLFMRSSPRLGNPPHTYPKTRLWNLKKLRKWKANSLWVLFIYY